MRHLNDLKVPMLIRKIEDKGDQIESDSDLKQLLLEVSGAKSLPDAIELIKNHNFRIVANIKNLSWEALGINEPKLTLTEEA